MDCCSSANDFHRYQSNCFLAITSFGFMKRRRLLFLTTSQKNLLIRSWRMWSFRALIWTPAGLLLCKYFLKTNTYLWLNLDIVNVRFPLWSIRFSCKRHSIQPFLGTSQKLSAFKLFRYCLPFKLLKPFSYRKKDIVRWPTDSGNWTFAPWIRHTENKGSFWNDIGCLRSIWSSQLRTLVECFPFSFV